MLFTLMCCLGGAVRAGVDEVRDWGVIGDLQDSCKAGNLLSHPKCQQLVGKLSNINNNN